ncbi:MAG: TraR/DksA family transcriptional regulator [Candidatus Marinimicrobia bacterium]|nr:TraR/DksA family transcriptional regulator [Candidatus Neomarinimicrobiota bacterium]MDD9887531.1 TraR/DksA family transcriptional regulator [Candidatus Neomarinimicrobiota bacterium]MDD9930471.1 TraR/DksA family transcriptional regulator [Candidatus Neomarinimicrobiota bacterium]|tara:strand:- start:1055 stop:1447 length:393 start_codon:yes stop_codon:yes gene_type:complete
MAKQYSKTKLAKFRKSIEEKMGNVSEDVDTIREGLGTASNKQGGVTPDSIYSLHMADAGTDSHEQEKNFMLMNRGSDYFKNLEIALERIDEGTFGICKICDDLIPEERMMEVPNATKCVDCKEKGKLGLG